jgi:21S rRNA (GM2251-2'-O)-methyltransferase
MYIYLTLQGFILESSPLPVPPITELGSSSITAGTFELTLDKQSKEDALVNGTKNQYMYKSSGWRHPLVLYVDGVLDEGNLGAIARSAYFLGVDALVTPSRQSAPWSHIALKASAGAAEAIPVFQVSAAADFLGRSAREGWRIYASDSLPPGEQQPHSVSTTSASSLADFASSVIYTYARSSKRLSAEHCPVESHPTVLMMGAESTGLRTSLLNLAHYKVGIKHGRDVDEVGVDSLNVSVAASLLCYQVLQKPKPRRKAGELMF